MPIVERYTNFGRVFKLNANATVGGKSIEVQRAKSIYGDDEAINQIAAAIEKDSDKKIRLYYVNKEKIPPVLEQTVRKHGFHVPIGIVHSINEAGSPVKQNIKSQTDTWQFKNWFGS